MHADAERSREFDIAVDQHVGASIARMLRGAFDEPSPAQEFRSVRAQLHAPYARIQRLAQRRQPARIVVAGLGRDEIVGRSTQRGHHRAIRIRHRIARKLVFRHPDQRLAVEALERAAPGGDAAHVEAQALVRILLRHRDHPLADAGVDIEFFAQLADQRLLRRFARIDLAAREFPQTGEVATLGAARQQDAPAGVGDHASDDVDTGSLRVPIRMAFRASASIAVAHPGARLRSADDVVFMRAVLPARRAVSKHATWRAA